MFQHIENLILNRKISSVNALFANTMLRTAAVSLFGIFEPIFIYGLTGRLETVLFYYLIARGGTLIFSIPAANLIIRLGFRRSVLFSNIFLSGLIISLILSGKSLFWLILFAFSHHDD